MSSVRQPSGRSFSTWLAVVVAVIGCAAVSPAWAANVTFTGPGALAWESTANWIGGSLPTSSDVAVFTQNNGNTTTTLNAAYSVAGLRFTNTGSTLIQAGTARQYLTVGASGITLESGAGAATIGSNAAQANRVGLVLAANHSWTNNSTSILKKESGNMGGAVTCLEGFTLTYDGSGPIDHFGSIGNSGTSLAGPGTIARNGSGTTSLYGASSTGTFNTTINSGAILQNDANAFGIGTITINGGAIGSGTANFGTSNAMTWSGNFAITGTTQWTSSGTVTIAGASRTVTVNAPTYVLSGRILDGGNVLGFTKSGPGLLDLRGANAYTGPTTISSGTVRVNGNQSAATGLFTVDSGAVLAGTGTIGGAISVLGGGIVAPGVTVGTLTGSSAFSLAATSILRYDLIASNTTVGGGINDLITGVTDLALAGILNVTGSGDWTTVADNTAWRLFNYTGTLSGAGLTLGSMPTLAAGKSFTIDTATPGQVNLVVTTPVPEPATWLSLATGLGSALCWRRARRRPRAA